MENDVMINFGDYDEFEKTRKNVIGEGTYFIVWSDSPDYVYKVDKSIRGSLDEQKELIQKKNNTGIMSPMELVGYMTSEGGMHPVFKQKRFVMLENYIIDWMKNHGWKKVGRWAYTKGNQFVNDVKACNVALDENFNPIVIDMDLYENV